MSYTDLSTMKKINGEPADLRYFIELNENDAYLKAAADAEVNFAALDRNITPATDRTYLLGSAVNAFLALYAQDLISEKLVTYAGTLLNPAIKIGLVGLSSISPSELSVITNGLVPAKINSAGMTLGAANNGVLKLQNTFPASASLWSLGSDETGLVVTDLNSGTNIRATFGSSFTSLYNNIRTVNGSETHPAYSFLADPTTGINKNNSLAELNFVISGANKLALDSDALSLLSGVLTLPVGTAGVPSLTFNGNESYGLSFVDNSLAIISNGFMMHKFAPTGTSVVSEIGLGNSSTIYSDQFGQIDAIRKAKGTQAVPGIVDEETDLYIQRIQGYTDAGFKTVAEFGALSLETYDSGAYGAMLSFSTTTVGSDEATEKLQIGPLAGASVHIVESFGLHKVLVNTPGLGQQIDVSGTSKIAIDATSGNIEIKGFVGGKEGQMLYIYKKVPTNTFTLVFNSPTATQKVLLKGSTNFVNTNDYGGITLSFDDGIWREVSRS